MKDVKRNWFMIQGNSRLIEFVNMLYLPYTFMNLSFVMMGAFIAPKFDIVILGLTLLAYFFGLGIGAHALDQLNGKPWGTRLSNLELWMIVAASMSTAVGIGLYAIQWIGYPLLLFIATAFFSAFAYNLGWGPRSTLFGVYKEKPETLFHGVWFFSLAWGFLPVITSYYAQAQSIGWPAIILGTVALILSLREIRLSRLAKAARSKGYVATQVEQQLKLLVLVSFLLSQSFLVIRLL